MRTTVDIPDELFQKAKRIAAEKGETLEKVLIRALQKEVEALLARESARGRNPLPSVRLPKTAPIFNLSPRQLLTIDAEEEVFRSIGFGQRTRL